MTTRQRVSITWGALRGLEDTGRGLGIGMASVSLGSDAPASRVGVPGVHSWSRRLRRGVNISLGELAKMHGHYFMKINFRDT